MCGIAAIYAYLQPSPPIDRDELLRRGPDRAGLWVSQNGNIRLAHRRLSIIDLSPADDQPMSPPDGRLRIVFNGEIYNYRKLRDQLKTKGHLFRSDSDTEVLLHAWREYGQKMVHHLRGMFAFVSRGNPSEGFMEFSLCGSKEKAWKFLDKATQA